MTQSVTKDDGDDDGDDEEDNDGAARYRKEFPLTK